MTTQSTLVEELLVEVLGAWTSEVQSAEGVIFTTWKAQVTHFNFKI